MKTRLRNLPRHSSAQTEKCARLLDVSVAPTCVGQFTFSWNQSLHAHCDSNARWFFFIFFFCRRRLWPKGCFFFGIFLLSVRRSHVCYCHGNKCDVPYFSSRAKQVIYFGSGRGGADCPKTEELVVLILLHPATQLMCECELMCHGWSEEPFDAGWLLRSSQFAPQKSSCG